MKLLIIGGTKFVGRALVDSALANGHEVTLFNRGKTNPDLYPDVEKIIGDRDGGLDALHSRQWDAAIDTCGYVPRIVKASAEKLVDQVGHYTFISTISVYPLPGEANRDENAELATVEDETTEEITGDTYGALKVLCEQAAEEAMPGRVLVVRPGLIVGPYDPTNRFTYWVTRAAKGGETLAFANPDNPVQFIDVRDLAEWTIHMIEQQQTGIYNATGPADRITMEQFLQTCANTVGNNVDYTWVDEAFLTEQEVAPFFQAPMWLPPDVAAGMNTINIQQAIAAGLTYRPLVDTIRDTFGWVQSGDNVPDEPPAGMSPERETELLAAWKMRG